MLHKVCIVLAAVGRRPSVTTNQLVEIIEPEAGP